jgi:hypothetical protein
MNLRRLSGNLLAGLVACGAVLVASSTGCSSSSTPVTHTDAGTKGDSPSGNGCTTPADDDYAGCNTCTFASGATPTMCSQARSVNACCDWVQAPLASTTLVRAVGLHDYSSTDPTIDFTCLGTPPVAGAVHTTTLTGYVKIFSSGTDTAGVNVQVFNVNTSTGALGAMIGSTTTTTSSPSEMNTWLNACTSMPCTFRQYTIEGVPTETPLVIETSDAGMNLWSTLYDYNIYFSDTSTCVPGGGPCVSAAGTADGGGWTTNYDVTTVAPADISTAANAAMGAMADPTKGVLAGEVHDCGDIRVSGANVDTDQAHLGPMFYFGTNEADPLPDSSRATSDEGTSDLGLFGALDMPVGVPIRVSAIGNVNGQDTLLGTNVVQAFAGPAVTAISLRGRRPYQ